MVQAIILCGGRSLRLKPDIWIPKPLVTIKNEYTLVDYQIDWLQKYPYRHSKTFSYLFDKIVLATSREVSDLYKPKQSDVVLSVENEKLGTAGAIKKAIDHIDTNKVYIFNVDDIVMYDPMVLMHNSYTYGGAILVTKARSPYGKVVLSESNGVLRFEEKPILDYWTNVGHYVLTVDFIKKWFPDKGSMEDIVLGKLANEGLLYGNKFTGTWLTLNTYKDLMRIRDYFRDANCVHLSNWRNTGKGKQGST